jgi:uncharacterized small protein (DUF1192 family)
MKLLVQWQPDPNTVANCKQVPDDFKDAPDGWEVLTVEEFNKRAEPLQAEVTRRKLERLETEKIEREEAAAKFEEVKEDPVTKTDVTDTELKLQATIDTLEARIAALESKLK